MTKKMISDLAVQVTVDAIIEIGRVRKPLPETLVSTQLFCILVWVLRSNNQDAYFTQVEQMFEEWQNCQSYLLQLGHGLIQDLKTVTHKLPVLPCFHTFIRALDAKLQQNS